MPNDELWLVIMLNGDNAKWWIVIDDNAKWWSVNGDNAKWWKVNGNSKWCSMNEGNTN